jgi:flagellar hook-basal body complex protein FliE
MNNLDIDQVLARMRAIGDQARSTAIRPQAADFSDLSSARIGSPKAADFSDLLKESIDKVNETQMQAGKLADAFETGASEVSLAEVMISLQKASVSFQAMTQVRNKLVDAYKDIMNMPM